MTTGTKYLRGRDAMRGIMEAQQSERIGLGRGPTRNFYVYVNGCD
ncbi:MULTISPECIES: hypothetical protein [Bradyrhizobium]|jgi:hypothetical protein|nr:MULTISPECIES: hypothetical protein [Bradyrhizobium]